MIFPLKILLFITNQICQQTNLIDAFQAWLSFDFPWSKPLYCFSHFPIKILVLEGLDKWGTNF